MKTEIILDGMGISDGIAFGVAHVRPSLDINVPSYHIDKKDIAAEMQRFLDSVEKAQAQLNKLQRKAKGLPTMAGEEIGYLLEAHLQILSSNRLLDGVRQRITDENMNAEMAVKQTLDQIIEAFGHLQDDFSTTNQTMEIREVRNRLIRNLTKTTYVSYKDLPDDTVLIADTITPADTANMDPAKIIGFATVTGGGESHTAIMARSMDMPAVSGINNLLESVTNGDEVILDGEEGKLIIHPTPKTRERYEIRAEHLAEKYRAYEEIKDLPSKTKDGVEVVLRSNLESLQDYDFAESYGARGIGLVRTEFCFIGAVTAPDEETQFQKYKEFADKNSGRPLYIRLFDFGGDKPASFLDPSLYDSMNPSLGLRAIRLQLKDRSLLHDQLNALLRVAAFADVRIIVPMISKTSEVELVKIYLQQQHDELYAKGVDVPKKIPPVGIMVEIPAVAIAADLFAKVSDFMAIGSNDLTMYTLAVDRSDEMVSYLYNPLHPSVLRLVHMVHRVGKDTKLPVSMCGEMAGDARYTALLIGMGARELSMSPALLPRVKNKILKTNVAEAEALVKKVMEAKSEEAVSRLIDDFNLYLERKN